MFAINEMLNRKNLKAAIALIEKMEEHNVPRNDVIYANLIERLLSEDRIDEALSYYIKVTFNTFWSSQV